MTDEELRATYRSILQKRADGTRAGCLVPEELAALAEGRLATTEREAALEHVSTCASCREEFDLLRAVARAGVELQREESDRGSRLGGMRWRPAIAAAALLVIASGTWNVLRNREDSVDIARSGGGVELIAPIGARRDAAAPTFRWHSVSGATRYELSLLSAGGQQIFVAATRDTAMQLPDSVRLVQSAEYLWTVHATFEDGTGRQGAPARFRLVAP